MNHPCSGCFGRLSPPDTIPIGVGVRETLLYLSDTRLMQHHEIDNAVNQRLINL